VVAAVIPCSSRCEHSAPRTGGLAGFEWSSHPQGITNQSLRVDVHLKPGALAQKLLPRTGQLCVANLLRIVGVQNFPDVSPSHYYKATPIIVDDILDTPNAVGLLEPLTRHRQNHLGATAFSADPEGGLRPEYARDRLVA